MESLVYNVEWSVSHVLCKFSSVGWGVSNLERRVSNVE